VALSLTRPGLVIDPNASPSLSDLASGGIGDDQVYFDSPAKRAKAFARIAASQAQPTMANVTDDINAPAAPADYQTDAGPGPQPTTSVLSDTIPEPHASTEVQPQSTSAVPKFIKPSIQDTTNDTIASPRLTKLGKLMTLIRAAATGALAGRAAQEQAIIASGGHRSGGIGTSFEAGMVAPLQEQERQNELLQNQAQTQIAQGQARYFPLLQALGIRGKQAELAKTSAEIDRDTAQAGASRAHADYYQSAAAQKQTPTLDQQIAAATADAQKRGVNPLEDKNVSALLDVKTAQLRQPQDPTNPDAVWYRAFKTENGREPGTADVLNYMGKKAQQIHVNTPGSATKDDVQQIADAIESGQQPPDTKGLYRNTAAVRAELARRGFDLTHANEDWQAVQKHLATLNGQQQTRLLQSINSAQDMLTKIDGLYGEWQNLAHQSGYKVVNRGTLQLMKNLPGRAGAVAQALEAQIADLNADIGNIYMGGNSPTDRGLELASKTLQSEWNDETFREGLRQARANVRIRYNSVVNSQPVGVRENSPYLQPSGNQNGGGGTQQKNTGYAKGFTPIGQ
jgi:hypothetical protein